MRTTISIKEAKKKNLTMRDDEVNKAIALAEQVSAFYPAEAVINVSNYENKLNYERTDVKLKHDFLELYISFGYTKKYVISCYNLDKFRNVERNRAYETPIEKPNQIGVLNEKKILAWVNYYEEIYQRLEKKDKENGSKKEAFLESIKGMPVRWFGEGERGEIVKNGIVYKFHIQHEYVSETIEIHYKVSSTLAAFKLLSDNKYK